MIKAAKHFEEATVLKPDELDFINKVALSAFEREDRPYVLIAICGHILANIVSMSEGELSPETALKFTEMAMHTDNLD